jgi:hypothetical protein
MRISWAVIVGVATACLTNTSVLAQPHGAVMTHGGKSATTAPPMKAGTPVHVRSKGASASTPATSESAPTTSGSVAPTAPAPRPTSAPVNPIASKIASHPQLNAKITALLPAHSTLNQASAGFKNQGQFIAALHVSRNLGIPFKALKADMTTKHMSLGQAIHDLKHTSTATATAQASKAEHEADIDSKSTTTTVASTAKSRTKKTQMQNEGER